MQALVIIKGEIGAQVAHRLSHRLIVFEIDFFIFHASPQPLDENVIERTPSAIPTDTDLSELEPVGKLGTGKLHPLVTVEDLRRGSLQGLLQSLQAETGIQRDGGLPGHDKPTIPVENRHQVQEAVLQTDVRDVRAPDLIHPLDAHISEQIWIALHLYACSAQA